MRIFGTAAGLAAVAIAAAACTGGSDSGAAPSSSGAHSAPKLSWHGCGGGFECGTLQVPLDHDRPGGGERIELAVIRLPAGGKRIGSLVTNPGGPGASGVGFVRESADAFSPAVRRSFDIVGFDPRGVGQSRPSVRCLSGRQLDRFYATDTSPDNRAEVDDLAAQGRQWARDCQAKEAKILPYVSTHNAARDMDALRAALGERALTYYGASYGTYLGAMYAEQFPARVRALVLDGAVDPRLTGDEMDIEQGKGFDTALRSYIADCVRTSPCPLGDSSEAATRRLRRLFADADRKPLANGLGDGRKVNEPLAALGVASALYDKRAWPVLTEALRKAIDQGDGTTLLRFADAMVERDNNGDYSNQAEANMAINCVDKPYSRTLGGVEKVAAQAQRGAPVFGQFVAWGAMPCTYWPVRPPDRPTALTAKGAKPIVVVGTTRDPATPYGWAQHLAAQLQSGRLLTLDGDGHTAYLQGNPCIRTAVDRYIIDGVPPQNGLRCR